VLIKGHAFMNKHILIPALFLLILCFAPGCVTAPKPSGPGDTGLEANDLSASFFYLKSRRHLSQGELDQAETALKKAIEKDTRSSFLKQDLIRVYHQQKKADQALALAKVLVEDDPENVDNLIILVRLQKGDRTDPEFQSLLKKIIRLDPENKETYLRLGRIYMDNEELDQAMALFTQMVKAFPNYYVAHFYLGEILLATGKTEDAKAAFEKTLKLEPELVEPRFRLIEILESAPTKKNKQKIIAGFEKILEIEPGNDRAALEMALFYYKTGEIKKADALFARLSEDAKKNPRLIMSAVDTFITSKRYKDAVIVFSQLRKADPANTNLIFFTGMAHEALGDIDKAIELYLKVTPDHPQYKKTILSIAFLYRDKNQPEQAIQFLEQHHSQSPADIDIISYLASFYEDENQNNRAITLLQKGLKQVPENTILLFKLGALQDKIGLRQDCINTMKSVIRLDPENTSALNYLGYTYAEMEIYLDQALDLIQRAMAIKPGDPYITDSLGWVYFKKGAYDQAIAWLEKAAELSEFETIIASHLGDAYVKTGQYPKAVAVYKKALTNAKEDQEKETQEIKQKLEALDEQGHAVP